MRAITAVPGKPEQLQVGDFPDPTPAEGSVLVRGRLLGICGTDVDIVENGYGWLPPGGDRLVIGHESLGEVLEAPADSGLRPGDLVAGIVRHPDPVPCAPCAHGDWDFCANGEYTERGIKARNGFGAEIWRTEPEFAIRLDPALGDCGVLMEPASILAKAWEQIERIGARFPWEPSAVLVTGAGPIGLCAALMGAQRGLDVHVLDRNGGGPKVELLRDLGATFHTGDVRDIGLTPDIVVETTGHGPLVTELGEVVARNAIVCLTGIASAADTTTLNTNAINKLMVLDNTVVFGSVNAARRHYEQAAASLAQADHSWLERMITRRVAMAEYPTAVHKGPDDIKVVVDLRQ
ncbi:threonine dehydrogenase-like Zn-dependent dehydrogenase [Nocardia transvalensis]|uniref:Threonine dehydrogenase-like Zn-dependent dehydrogenase n=1 Tax=Nocardia transvalensis TaxID=37333 RepID=A0A7W9ULJ7_9NOCA|nr:glucose 1-dehydrogenase [Nocardia transvalensis]MBB5917641.1 threonine dehydrogenase-like Zn-dependent dehydrogenase [Nocardia transvalensis]